LYPATFVDFTSKFKDEMKQMFEDKVFPKHAILDLRKKGVY